MREFLLVTQFAVLVIAIACSGDSTTPPTTPPSNPAPMSVSTPHTTPAPPIPRVVDFGYGHITWGWDSVGAVSYEVITSHDSNCVIRNDNCDSWYGIDRVSDPRYRYETIVADGRTIYIAVRAEYSVDDPVRVGPRSDAVPGTTLTLARPIPYVASVGDDHITWAWNAIAEADRYRVQVWEKFDGEEVLIGEWIYGTDFRVTVGEGATLYGSVISGVRYFDRSIGDYVVARSHPSERIGGTSSGVAASSAGLTSPVVSVERSGSTTFWEWNEVRGATAYEIEASLGDIDFSDPDFREMRRSTFFSLSLGKLAFVRVRAIAVSSIGIERSEWSSPSE